MSDETNNPAFPAGFFSNLFGGAVTGGGIYKLADMLRDDRGQVQGTVNDLSQGVNDNVQFNPFTVKSGVGTTTSGPDGTTMGLSPEQQQLQNMFFGGAQDALGAGQQDAGALRGLMTDFRAGQTDPRAYQGIADMKRGAMGLSDQYMGLAGQDPTAREGDIYSRLRAMQQPEEERARQGMQNNLFSSGRGGMGTSTYGGTPESFGFEKARAEAMNQASYQAMDQAQKEMMNYGNMANTFSGLGSDLAGQQQNLASMNVTDMINLASGAGGLESTAANTAAGLYGAGMSPYDQLYQQAGLGQQSAGMGLETDLNRQKMLTDLGLGGLGTELNYSTTLSNMLGQAIPGLASAGAGIGSQLDGNQAIQDFLKKIGIG